MSPYTKDPKITTSSVDLTYEIEDVNTKDISLSFFLQKMDIKFPDAKSIKAKIIILKNNIWNIEIKK